jgi:hypothetical protein
MHIISLYLVLLVCAAIFDVMCVKKTEPTKRGLSTNAHITCIACPLALRTCAASCWGRRVHLTEHVDFRLPRVDAASPLAHWGYKLERMPPDVGTHRVGAHCYWGIHT